MDDRPCGAVHPEHPEWVCEARTMHADHYCVVGAGTRHAEPHTWTNDAYIATSQRQDHFTTAQRSLARGLASRQSEHRHEPPIVRTNDPWTSHVAAQRIQPKRGTRKAMVLAYLLARPGEWVRGAELANQEVGGSEGLRRARELRTTHGYNVERKPDPESQTSWLYRLSP